MRRQNSRQQDRGGKSNQCLNQSEAGDTCDAFYELCAEITVPRQTRIDAPHDFAWP
jgi:hypothetical protein